MLKGFKGFYQMNPSKIKDFLTQRLKAINKDVFLFIALSPLVTVLIMDFHSFTLGWNEGRGGLLFALFFLII